MYVLSKKSLGNPVKVSQSKFYFLSLKKNVQTNKNVHEIHDSTPQLHQQHYLFITENNSHIDSTYSNLRTQSHTQHTRLSAIAYL